MIKNFVKFLLSPNLVISYYIYQIRHLIIISALEIKQKEIDCVSSKKTQSNARNARPIPIKKRPNIRYKAKKKINPRDGVFSQTIKQKTNPFFPPLKTEISLKKIERKTLCIILFL